MRRFELPTPWSVAKCSIQLSYTHILFEISLNAIHSTNIQTSLRSFSLSFGMGFHTRLEHHDVRSRQVFNAGDRNRTGTVSLRQDFKSCASASSATPANRFSRELAELCASCGEATSHFCVQQLNLCE